MDKFETLLKKINDIQTIDAHTHLNAKHLSARGLHDILLYHMVITELYSSGCSNGSRLSDDPGEAEVTERIVQAIDYLENVQNTSLFWLLKGILKDLYGWCEPITKDNWQKLHEIIQSKYSEPNWAKEIFAKAGIARACTELALRGDGQKDDFLFYSLEWAFITRNQWGIFDAPLYELEYAWGFDSPQSPLPVTTGQRLAVKRKIKTVADVKEVMNHYLSVVPIEKIVSSAQHVSTDINYSLVTDEQMQQALDNRANAGEKERDVYASYLFELFLSEMERKKFNFVYQFSIAAEPLPFETASRISQRTITQIGEIIARHPKIDFHCHLSSLHANQGMSTLCRQLPNFYLIGAWWHSFFPSIISQVFDQRLDMLPTNKQLIYFSDAYCAEWAYVKSKLIRYELAKCLYGRIEKGQYDMDSAIKIATTLLKETPEKMYGLSIG